MRPFPHFVGPYCVLVFSVAESQPVQAICIQQRGAALQSLITTYQQSWITTQELDNIKSAGFNAIRVPVSNAIEGTPTSKYFEQFCSSSPSRPQASFCGLR
jgi:aryl-phospho-beta-D-glucosidase BglC (GH1 family)